MAAPEPSQRPVTAHYALGGFHFTLDGEHPIASCLMDEFAPLAVSSAEPPHVRFRFVDALGAMSGASHVQPLSILEDRFAVTRGRLSYQIAQMDGGLDVTIVPRPLNVVRRFAPQALARFTDWNHLTRDETIAKSVVYDIFDYVAQIGQLPLGQSHLHASSFERDGVGVAIIAWGGVGKTTAMLKLVLEDGWRYLSDDLAVIDRSGRLWRSPKRLQVYGYNVANEAELRSCLMSGRTLADRAAWSVRGALRGPNRVRRRVSAEQLFGCDRVAISARLGHAIYIERVECQGFDAQEIDPNELAARATATVLKEMHPFVELSLALHSGERHPVLPSVEAMRAATHDVLSQALSRARAMSVRIPIAARPNEIADCLRGLLGDGSSSRPAAGVA